MVHDYVFHENIQCRIATSRQVLELFVKYLLLLIMNDDQGKFFMMDYASEYSTLRWWLALNGYKQGRQNGNLVMR